MLRASEQTPGPAKRPDLPARQEKDHSSGLSRGCQPHCWCALETLNPSFSMFIKRLVYVKGLDMGGTMKKQTDKIPVLGGGLLIKIILMDTHSTCSEPGHALSIVLTLPASPRRWTNGNEATRPQAYLGTHSDVLPVVTLSSVLLNQKDPLQGGQGGPSKGGISSETWRILGAHSWLWERQLGRALLHSLALRIGVQISSSTALSALPSTCSCSQGG